MLQQPLVISCAPIASPLAQGASASDELAACKRELQAIVHDRDEARTALQEAARNTKQAVAQVNTLLRRFRGAL